MDVRLTEAKIKYKRKKIIKFLKCIYMHVKFGE